MRRLIFILLLILPLLSDAQNLPQVRGMYVDNIPEWLGTAKEDSLLIYCRDSSYNYIALYDLQGLDLRNTTTRAQLSAFISKAKTKYGIQQVGAIGETLGTFTNGVAPYNSSRTSQTERFDVFNVEFEFWTTSSVSSGGVYCEKYLRNSGYSCDTAGAFRFAKDLMRRVDSVASANYAISEVYVGWFNTGQAQQFFGLVDRILVHAYRTGIDDMFAYTKNRLSQLTSTGKPVDIMIIFSNEPDFLGPWLDRNKQLAAWNEYKKDYDADASTWKQLINLRGYQWFVWSLFDKPVYPPQTPCSIPDVNMFATTNITTSSATVSWPAVSGAVSYNVQYRVRNSGSAYSQSISTASNSLTLSGLSANTNYEFIVMTVCWGGSSAFSSSGWFTTQQLPACGTPSALAATTTGVTATLSWTGGTNNTSFSMRYRRVGSTLWTSSITSVSPVTVSGLTPGTNYEFQVAGICTSGQSIFSAARQFATRTLNCATPTSLTTTAVKSTTATANWGSNTVADSVRIRYRIQGTSAYIFRAVAANNGNRSYNIINLVPNKTYEWNVQTICGTSTSAWSARATFTTTATGTAFVKPQVTIDPMGQYIAIEQTTSHTELKITDVYGQTAINKTVRDGIIRFDGLPQGMYIISVTTNDFSDKYPIFVKTKTLKMTR